jgi:hypothetical protein
MSNGTYWSPGTILKKSGFLSARGSLRHHTPDEGASAYVTQMLRANFAYDVRHVASVFDYSIFAFQRLFSLPLHEHLTPEVTPVFPPPSHANNSDVPGLFPAVLGSRMRI